MTGEKFAFAKQQMLRFNETDVNLTRELELIVLPDVRNNTGYRVRTNPLWCVSRQP